MNKLLWAETSVRSCRAIALRYFASTKLRVRRKGDGSPVTLADGAIEERLRRALERTFPGESILGEEFGRSGPDGSTYWCVDPIDGTRAFSRGLPSWGIMLGRVERGRAVLGVVDYPAIGVTIAGGTMASAYERSRSGKRKLPKAKSLRKLSDAVIFHGGFNWWQRSPYAKGFARLSKKCFLERAYGDCYGYLWAFRGCADAVIDYGVKPWDVIPLAAIARSIGWGMTDCAGKVNITGPETVMAHPSVAKRVCRILSNTRL